jgi:hypothetical protein
MDEIVQGNGDEDRKDYSFVRSPLGSDLRWSYIFDGGINVPRIHPLDGQPIVIWGIIQFTWVPNSRT